MKRSEKSIQQDEALQIIDFADKISGKLSDMGRQVVIAIIAGAWTLSYSEGKFTPSIYIVWSIALAFSYLIIDLLYYFVSRVVYMGFIKFENDSAIWQLRSDIKTISRRAKVWKTISSIWIIIKIPILIISSALIIVHVFSSI